MSTGKGSTKPACIPITAIKERRNMNIRKSARGLIFIPLTFLLLGTLGAAAAHATTGDPEGSSTDIPAVFNGQPVTVNMLELPNGGENAVLANNPSVNTIYAGKDLDIKAQPFPPVINAIQGAGFNPHWQQVLISFPQGVTPHGFASEADVLAAAKAGQITLTVTAEVYRCSVVSGPK
jgi:hypothetical protein